jgi:hypothetical protein
VIPNNGLDDLDDIDGNDVVEDGG